MIRDENTPLQPVQPREDSTPPPTLSVERVHPPSPSATEDRSPRRHPSLYDPLTGLPHRVLFLDRLQKSLVLAERSKQTVAVLCLGLSYPKSTDGLRSRDFGLLRRAAAGRLAGCVRASDTLARLEEDEYAAFLAADAQEPAGALSMRMLKAFTAPFPIKGETVRVGLRIGISFFPQDASNLEKLLRNARNAMRRIDCGGRRSPQFFSPEQTRRTTEQLALQTALRESVEREELALRYRPHWDLLTGSRYVVEVLPCWRHSEFGEISMDYFLSLAERSEVAVDLDAWMLRSACRQGKIWMEAGFPVERMAVRVSKDLLRQRDFSQRVEGILERTQCAPAALELEFNEVLFSGQAEHAVSSLQALGKLGVHLSIGNFSADPSVSNHLRKFPVDRIKIDRALVAGIDRNPDHAALVAAVLALARTLNIRVLAEGVERLAQMEFLQHHGCSEAMGFLLGTPMEAEEFTRWMEKPPVPFNALGAATENRNMAGAAERARGRRSNHR